MHVSFGMDIGEEIPLDAHKESLGSKDNGRCEKQVRGAL